MKNATIAPKRISDSLRRVAGILICASVLTAMGGTGLSRAQEPAADGPKAHADFTRADGVSPVRKHAATTGKQLLSAQVQPGVPKIWLGEPQGLAVTYVGHGSGNTGSNANGAMNQAQGNNNGNDDAPKRLSAGQAQPVSLAKGDLDGDGVEDLVIGYAAAGKGILSIHRGNLDAFAPQSQASFQAIAHGQFPSPFLPQARAFSVPVTPDFIAVGDFTGYGHNDIAMAARGGNALYILAGDGKGNFAPPQMFGLPGGVTSLAAGGFGTAQPFTKLLVGTSSQTNGFSLVVLGASQQGLQTLGNFPLNEAASSISFSDFGSAGSDAIFVSGGQVQILHSASMNIETVPLPFYASSLVLGSFVYDRNGGTQIAAVASDGTVQIVAHNEFDPRPFTANEVKARIQAGERRLGHSLITKSAAPSSGWKVVESIFSPVPLGAADAPPIIFRTRILNNGADDIAVMNASSGQFSVVSHANPKPGATTFVPGTVTSRPYAGAPVAALPMRVNVDGRPGVVALHQGQIAPSVMMPLPDPTFFVNTFNDPTPTSPIANACNNTSFADLSSSCSLREAIIKANGDTIMLQAGTYVLTLGRTVAEPGIPAENAETGTLNINNSVNIIGAGQSTTIITWGTPTPAGSTVDMVMSVNEDIQQITSATASISNLTIQNGVNHGSNSEDGDGGCMEFDTGTNGTATLTLTSVTLQNCSTTQGGGGGLVIFNFVTPSGGGGVTISNSIIQGNSVVDVGQAGNGGGIAIAQDAHMTMTASTVQNNNATQNNGSGIGSGGGILAFTPQNVSAATGESFIHSSTISGNKTAGFGGGINTSASISIDTGTVISGNAAGTGGTAGQEGGGLYLNPLASCPLSSTCTVSLNQVTITGNTATGNGGGISYGNDSAGTVGALSMTFSRLAGNTTSGGSGSNLSNNHGTATVTDDWWGTNNASSTINSISATTTFDPFIVLTNTASPNKIQINQSSTLTGDMSNDNHGNPVSLSNLTQIIGLPIKFDNPVLGTIPQVQPETLNSSAQATATYNAGGTGGSGSADATVDNQTVTADITVLQPPSIIKSFNPTKVALNTPSTITFGITNPNTVTINSSFTDTLPTNLVVAATPVVVNNCGGSVTATAGSGTISFANAALPAGSCVITANVSSAVDNVYANSVTIDSTDAGNGNTFAANPSLTVINPPHIVKTFGAASVPFGGTTSLTLTVSSANVNETLSAISFTDTLPTAPGTLVVASPSGLNSTCTGTASGGAGSGAVSLTGASLSPGASCIVSVNVQGTAVGAANNSVTVSDTTAGTGNTSTALLTVTKSDTATTVTSSANPSVFGQSVTFTATVSAVAPGAGTATGTVTFLDGGSPIGTGTLSGGIATFATSALAVGNHTITTSYGGDGNFNGSTGSLTGNPQVVNKANTATTVTSSANPSVFGQSVTFTATVSPVAPGAGTATGTVTFLDGGSPIGTGTLSGGIATFTTSALAQGNHTITTSYGGDGNFNGSTGSLTGNPQVVNKANTATTVTSSANPSVFGQPVTFTATASAVAPGAGTPTGTVTFLDGGSPIGTGTLSGGVATFTTSALAAGNHTITTSYGGDGNFNGSTGSLTGNPQVVNKANSATTVTSSSNPSVFGQSATFTATVVAVAPATGTPTGTVTFLDGGSPIGTGTLSGGIATFSTSALAAGNHTITTSYGGDGNFNGSTGSLTGNPQVVNKANSATTVTSSANPSVFGQSVTLTATVSPVAPGAGTPTGTVTFLDGGSPIGTGTLGGGIATFTTSALAVGNHTITTSYGGDGNFNGSTGSLTGNPQVVNKANTATTVTSSANPSVFGQSVTFTATVSPVAPGAGTATGTVTFLDGGSPIGTGTLSGGIATFTTSALAQGNHTITTSYGGDGNFNGSTGSLTGNPQVVNKANSATTVISSQNPSAVGQPVTFTATVVAVAPAIGTPTGTVTFLDGGNSIGTGTLSGGGVATFTTSALAAGSHTITTNYGGDGNFNGSTGSLTGNPQVIVAPPSIAKAFNPTSISLNGVTTLSFTITNPAANTVAEAGLAFTDTLPTGLVVAVPTGLVNSCGGTATAVGGSTSISLTGGTAAVSSACTVAVNVTGNASGQYTNTTGPVSSTNGGTGNTASANLTVATPPSIVEAFGVASIPFNGVTSLTFNIANPNTSLALTGVAFTDNLPAGVIVATPSNLTSNCGGSATAIAGGSAASLTAGTLAAGSSCTVSLNIQGSTPGVKNNSVQVTSTQGGAGNTSNATLTVVGPPVIIKAFGAASVPLGGSTSLSFTIQNNNTTQSLSGISFTDTLPAGLAVSTPNGLSGNACGVTPVAAAGSNAVSLSAGLLAATGTCTFSVNVTGTAAGTQNNTTSQVTSVEGGTGGTASASIAVVAPPAINKAFSPTSIAPSTNSALTFTITNPAANSVALAGVAFTDVLPAGTTVATPNGLAGACGAGTITAVAGSGSVTLAGGTIAASTTCTFSVNITGTASGTAVNTTGPVSSTNGGTGGTASASLTVAQPPSITKAFGAASIGLAGSTSLTFTIANPNATVAMTGVAFTDAIPSGLVVATPNGLTGSCGAGVITAVAGSSSVTLTGGTIPVSTSCTFAVNVTASIAGTKVNTTSTVTSTNAGTGGTATATINVLAPDMTITKSHTGNFGLGQTGAIYTLTANNIGAGPTAGTVTVTDTLPASLTATAMTGTGWTCTLATLTCTRADALAAAASYPPITLTVNVAANAPNSIVNNAAVSGGGELNLANDTAADTTLVTTFTVSAAPSTVTIQAGQLATFTLTVTPQGGAFTNPITFAPTGTPGKTTVTFVPATVTPGANPATLATNMQTTPGLGFVSRNSPDRSAPVTAILLPFGFVLLIGAGASKLPKDKKKAQWLALVLVIMFFGMGLMGCTGSQTNFNNLGTPPGTYPLTVTGTANGVPVSVNVTLVVTP